MKTFCLILFNRYKIAGNQFNYYFIKAGTREEAVSKFNNKYNLSLNAKSLNIDDLKEINFDFENELPKINLNTNDVFSGDKCIYDPKIKTLTLNVNDYDPDWESSFPYESPIIPMPPVKPPKDSK
jgi:hypothetical protein